MRKHDSTSLSSEALVFRSAGSRRQRYVEASLILMGLYRTTSWLVITVFADSRAEPAISASSSSEWIVSVYVAQATGNARCLACPIDERRPTRTLPITMVTYQSDLPCIVHTYIRTCTCPRKQTSLAFNGVRIGPVMYGGIQSFRRVTEANHMKNQWYQS